MTWKELAQKIGQMTEEEKEQEVLMSTEPGVILYPTTDILRSCDWDWKWCDRKPENNQHFLY